MKYLYVLVSNSDDYYSEQAFVSIYSLRLKNPDAFVSLLADNQTAEYLENNFQELIQSVNEFKVVGLDSKHSNKEKSRILKTTMRQHIDGDFLFIDCDTIICEDLSEIEKCGFDIGCVLDTHVLINKHWCKDLLYQNYEKCGFVESGKFDLHYNSGVIYCKDNNKTHTFFADWHSLWQISCSKKVIIDQPSFNQANIVNGKIIKELEGKWNCQIVSGGIKFFNDAKILHYFSSMKDANNPVIFGNNRFLSELRQSTNKLTLIEHGLKSIFEDNCTLVCHKISRKILLDVGNHPKIYDAFYAILHFCNLKRLLSH